jgi:hypothetical protein
MAVGDLTTLSNVLGWRTPVIAPGADTAQIKREITAASHAILRYLQRDTLGVREYVETRNGYNTQGMQTKNYPIQKINALTVGPTIVKPPVNLNGYGFVFEADTGMLYLRGYVFPLGFQNITIDYWAGFQQTDPDMPIGSDGTIQCSSLVELWDSNQGVAYAETGEPLVPVKSAPTVGQFVPPTGPDGFYLFNASEAATAVDITYGYTPRDVEEACIQLVILEYNRRSRIGENSKSLAGENISYYSSKAFTETITSRLEPYMNVVPNV